MSANEPKASSSTEATANDIARLAAKQKLCCGLVRCNLRRYTIKSQIMTGILFVSLFILIGLCTVCVVNIFTLGSRTKNEAIYGLTQQINTNMMNFSEAYAAEIAQTFGRREAATRAMAIAVSNYYLLPQLTFGEGTTSLFHEDTQSAPGAENFPAGSNRYRTKLSSSYYFPKTRESSDSEGCYLPFNGDEYPNLGENMNVKGCKSLANVLSDDLKRKEVDRSVMLDPYFRKYYSSVEGIDQIYIGFEFSGLFRQYPGNNANAADKGVRTNTYDPRKRPWYIDARAADTEIIQGRTYGKTIISAPYKGYSLGIWMVTLAKAVYDGHLLGVVGIDISIDNLQKKILSVNFLESGFVGLIESASRDSDCLSASCKVNVVAYPNFDDHVDPFGSVTTESVGLTDFIDDDSKYAQIFSDSSGILNFTHDGEGYVASHSQVRSATFVQKYVAIVIVTTREALAAVPKLTEKINATEAEVSTTVLVVTMITGLVVSYIVWTVTSNLSKPVSSMVKIANSVVTGAAEQDYTKDFQQRQKDMNRIKSYALHKEGDVENESKNEMVSLARSFLTMISGLKRDANRRTQHVLQPMNSYHGSQENEFVAIFEEEKL